MAAYKIGIEIFEGNGGTLRKVGDRIIYPESLAEEGICAWMYRGDGEKSYGRGQRFTYPDDAGKICPWLMGSIDSMVQALRMGAILPWTYAGTPYEKVIDPDGITTEYARCVDPTASGIVVKIIRTLVD
jgi:hypothetical protein